MICVYIFQKQFKITQSISKYLKSSHYKTLVVNMAHKPDVTSFINAQIQKDQCRSCESLHRNSTQRMGQIPQRTDELQGVRAGGRGQAESVGTGRRARASREDHPEECCRVCLCCLAAASFQNSRQTLEFRGNREGNENYQDSESEGTESQSSLFEKRVRERTWDR